ncbi:hypothetical protein [Trueperella bialowiezensis]|nr:hypothetical protein [Trueperella bialowiezensis]
MAYGMPDDQRGNWSVQTSGDTVVVVGEHAAGGNRSTPRTPTRSPKSPNAAYMGAVDAPRGSVSALESVSVDELCRSYAFQHSGALPGALPNWQMSGPLAEYCMNRGSEPAADPATDGEDAEEAAPVVSAADVGFMCVTMPSRSLTEAL